MDTIQRTVKSYILEEFLRDADPAELTSTTPLISGGILDSLSTIRLVAYLETQFGIMIAPHEASVEFLDTLDSIAGLVRSKAGNN